MPSLGPAEILVILVVALLVFGPNKMPEIARQVGKGMREFRRVQQHLKSELRDVVSEFDAPPSGGTTSGGDPVPMLPPRDDSPSLPPPPTAGSDTQSADTQSAESQSGGDAATGGPAASGTEPGSPADTA
jgi:sec-independent protein translocase protein TatA